MTRLTDHEIAEITGRPAEPQKAPETRMQAAQAKLAELDDRMARAVEKNRDPGESHAAAHLRLMTENPRLYEEHKKAKSEILAAHGVGNSNVSAIHA